MTYSFSFWIATKLSLTILLLTNVDLELYFNNFFHQLLVKRLFFYKFFHCFAKYAVIHNHIENFFEINFKQQLFPVCLNKHTASTKQNDCIVQLYEPSTALIQDQDAVEGFCSEVHIFAFLIMLEQVFWPVWCLNCISVSFNISTASVWPLWLLRNFCEINFEN